jgi:hypothetical protein
MEGFVPSVVFTALRQIEPFLRHIDERQALVGVGLRVQPHQKGEKSMRQGVRQLAWSLLIAARSRCYLCHW